MTDLARTLETELAAMTARAEKAEGVLCSLQHLIDDYFNEQIARHNAAIDKALEDDQGERT